MKPVRIWPPMKPLDWLVVSARWVWLSVLPIIAGLAGVMSPTLAYILIGWTVLSFITTLADATGWRPFWLQALVVVADLAFALAAVAVTGMLASPLWWALLIAAVSIGLRFGTRAVLLVSAAGGVAAAIMILITTPSTPWVLLPLTMQALSVVIAGGLLGWLASLVRARAIAMEENQAIEMARLHELERERSRAIFRMAASLNATLKTEEVLEMALDLGTRTLSTGKREDDHLVGGLLLFSEGALQVAAARRLTHADWRVSLPAAKGVIQQALASGESLLIHSPATDPELCELSALQDCGVVACIPLKADSEDYGVLLFGHQDAEHMTQDRVELLQAIGEQAMIALQNAILYRDLLREKERITEIQEEARKQMARDLHDGPTQTVATLAMRANFTRRLLDRDPGAAADELQKMEEIARRTTKEIRHMLFTLRPLILETQGLAAALQQLADKVRETHGQNVNLELEEDFPDDLESGKQAVLFYIVEEAVNNARKHAEAVNIWLRLKRQESLLLLEIEDDGVGFNVGSVDSDYEQRGSLGMVNMRERAELVGGTLHVDSAEGKGTRIRVLVPLTEERADRVENEGAEA